MLYSPMGHGPQGNKAPFKAAILVCCQPSLAVSSELSIHGDEIFALPWLFPTCDSAFLSKDSTACSHSLVLTELGEDQLLQALICFSVPLYMALCTMSPEVSAGQGCLPA